jgi:hypothetical protein
MQRSKRSIGKCYDKQIVLFSAYTPPMRRAGFEGSDISQVLYSLICPTVVTVRMMSRI